MGRSRVELLGLYVRRSRKKKGWGVSIHAPVTRGGGEQITTRGVVTRVKREHNRGEGVM